MAVDVHETHEAEHVPAHGPPPPRTGLHRLTGPGWLRVLWAVPVSWVLATLLVIGARAALGIPRDARVLLYAGRLVEEKGVQNVLRAMATPPDTTLLVIGRGRHEPALRAEAAALGLGARARFLGTIANEALGPYYAAADIVVMAGIFYEALGRMLMEACAHGVAVIGTNVGGIPYILKNDHDALLVPTEDPVAMAKAVQRLLTEQGLADRLSGNARKKVEQYDWPGIFQRWEKLIIAVAGEHK